MKVSKKELYMLLMVAGVAIVLCAFFFGFQKVNEKTETLRVETETLESEVKHYNSIKDNIEIYKTGIDDATTRIADVIKQFPVDVLPEDGTMLARELEKNDEYTFVDSATWGSEVTVYTVTSHPVESTNTPITYYLNNTPVTFSHTSSYEGIKDMLDYITQNNNRMAFESFSVAYDEDTGYLTGTTIVNFYSIIGSDKEYKSQNIPGIAIGKDNIFGTIDVPQEKKAK